ncbi:PepSY domain-containing protein [Methanobacterium sp. ACI-7]|uniref:PepSY domain-containing protein n=1 Tax=unclassified Methanobacterium TaxID=2627676 RepID=UPI0039C209CD
MIKKSIFAILAIIAAAGLVFAAYGNTGNSDTTVSDNLQKQQDTNDASSSSNSIEGDKISASKAQEIAQKYIEEPGAKAGNPKLATINGKNVYVVPIIDNGEQVGEIEIDAQTGANLGGAGGVQ